ncbi:hypothetical protein L1987_09945 [Smallanthus sonchifolius]|uniref:Uncharacterized protein n=1 Tax=Smallanthus sonchifolius TaxID=185202 RepID=A0ACB9JQQ0_9ASTR|nr:hypothetical protein L1987_09945 [Smallanthus sonchifolius]
MELDLHGSHRRASKEILLEEHATLVSSIKKKMTNTSDFGRICKVSKNFYRKTEEIYFPRLVSIGPFHRDNERLKAMEERKWQYLNTLILRAVNAEVRITKCVEHLKMMEDRARKCYGKEIDMTSDEFVEMMLLDGCFIIELFYKSCCRGVRRRGDPFLATNQVFSNLRHDLVLLENQIPFFVLQHLFNLVPIPTQCGDCSLIELAFRFFKKMVPDDPHDLRDKYGQEIHHLLDLIHQSFIPKTHMLRPQPTKPQSDQMNIPTATHLRKTGTRIKKTKSPSVFGVRFNKGALRIPALTHHDLMETVLRNLVAMENCCYDGAKYVTSYVFLMRNLIQSNEDAKILHNKGIIDKEEEFVTLFGKICVEVNAKDFYYGDLCEKLDGLKKPNISILCARKARKYVIRCLRAL